MTKITQVIIEHSTWVLPCSLFQKGTEYHILPSSLGEGAEEVNFYFIYKIIEAKFTKLLLARGILLFYLFPIGVREV